MESKVIGFVPCHFLSISIRVSTSRSQEAGSPKTEDSKAVVEGNKDCWLALWSAGLDFAQCCLAQDFVYAYMQSMIPQCLRNSQSVQPVEESLG